MKEDYAKLAKMVARDSALPYARISGNIEVLPDLSWENHVDKDRFLIMKPGWTVSRDTKGKIIKQKLTGVI